MKLYDSLSKSFKKLNINEKIKIYMCGPTVYDYIHIGNARPLFLNDTLLRFLNYKKIDYDFLLNITDIDDKIIKKAAIEKKKEKIISEFYYDEFIKDYENLNLIKPSKILKVTDKIDEIITYIGELVYKNAAYEINNNVYFDVKKFEKEYGKLSNQKIDNLINNKENNDDVNKENMIDFSLWKNTNEGIKFQSPWGMGRPGWHTECAFFINYYFNKKIDIHFGGIDLKFPHHENERIQNIAMNNDELSSIWVHNGHLTLNNFKMSKSLNNIIKVRDFINAYGSNVLRFIFLNSNYKQPLNINENLIQESIKWVNKQENIIKKINYLKALNKLKIKKGKFNIDETVFKFENNYNNDLKMQINISLINELQKNISKDIRENILDDDMFNIYYNFLNIMGFSYIIKVLDENTKNILKKWDQAILNNNYDLADKLREELLNLGIL